MSILKELNSDLQKIVANASYDTENVTLLPSNRS